MVIAGAGAVGGYFGARWQEAGHDVTFLVRPRRKAQLEQRGLRVQSPLGDAHVVPKLALGADEVGACDVVLLAVKNYHLPDILPTIATLAQRGAYVLPLLNGMEHLDVLADACGADRVLGGLVHIVSTLDADGQVLHTNRVHHITFGPLSEEQKPFCEQFLKEAGSANLQLILSDDVRVDMWKKYAFITAFSGVTTASRCTIGEILASPPTAAVFTAALEEMAQLAKAHGCPLPETFVRQQEQVVRAMQPDSTSSMHQDFRKRLPLEVDSLQGAAVRLARQAGIRVPTVEALYGVLLPHAEGARN